MKDFTLDIKQIAVLRQAHKNAITRSHAYRINAAILLGTGWTLEAVSNALLLDEETLRSYVQKYRDGNVNGLLSNKYSGNNAKKLSDEQESELKQHLEENLYRLTKEVVAYVKSKYQVPSTLQP